MPSCLQDLDIRCLRGCCQLYVHVGHFEGVTENGHQMPTFAVPSQMSFGSTTATASRKTQPALKVNTFQFGVNAVNLMSRFADIYDHDE